MPLIGLCIWSRYYAAHVAHQPYEVPESYNRSFSFIPNAKRQAYHAMVSCLDDVLAELIASFKAKGLWETTLMVREAPPHDNQAETVV
jgi:arylsulfatase A-like enzyme